MTRKQFQEFKSRVLESAIKEFATGKLVHIAQKAKAICERVEEVEAAMAEEEE